MSALTALCLKCDADHAASAAVGRGRRGVRWVLLGAAGAVRMRYGIPRGREGDLRGLRGCLGVGVPAEGGGWDGGHWNGALLLLNADVLSS